MCMFLFACELFAFILLLIIMFVDLAGEKRLFQNKMSREEPKKIEEAKEEKMKIEGSIKKD